MNFWDVGFKGWIWKRPPLLFWVPCNSGRYILEICMTPAQREVFLVVDEWWKSFGYGPTVDEIMDRIGARGRGNVQRKIDRLVTLGVLKKLRHVPRSLRPSYLRIRRII
jgi:hypothetical protein